MTSRLRVRTSIAAALAATAVSAIFAGSAFAAPPANDNFSNRQDLGSSLPTTVTGTTVEATAETGEPDHSGEGFADSSIWYQWIAPASQTIRFDACGSDSFPVVAVYTGLNVGALTPVGGEGTCQTTLSVTNGVTYKIALDGIYDPGPTELAIRAPAPPPNDAFGAAISLGSGTTFSAAGSTVDASREPGETDPNDSAGSVWYTWAPASSGEATVDTCTSDLDSDPTLTVYTGSAVDTLTPLAASDDNCAAGNGLGSKVTFAASAGTVYRIAVAALCDSCEGGFTLNGSQVVTTPTPPADPPANPPATKKCKKGQKLKKGKCVKKKKKRKKGKK